MVAHHADDQAETILMRLMLKRWRTGLQGIRAAEWIPECYGIHGVHHSGMVKMHSDIPMPVERGGVQILRPLLSFPKSRLIATCHSHGMAWAEDKSNQDQTLTPRNAIRHVFQTHQLPAALSPKSLIAIADKMKRRVDHLKKRVEELMRSLDFKLDIQTGSLSVRFPVASALLGRPILSEQDKNEAKNTAYMFLERVAGFVSFQDNPPTNKLSGIVSAIWPEFADHNGDGITCPSPLAASLCAFGIWWRRWDAVPTHLAPQLSDQRLNSMDWLLSRQPPEKHELGPSGLRLEFPPPPATVPLVSTANIPQPKWHLYDRWWIQVENLTRDHTVVLRFLTNDELRKARHRSAPKSQIVKNKDLLIESDRYQNIKIFIDLIKPTSLSRHLPGLFLVSPDGEEELFALPTLGAKAILPNERPYPDPPCTWDIRYKKIDLGNRRLVDVIAPRIHPETQASERVKRLPTRKWEKQGKTKNHTKSWTNRETDGLPGSGERVPEFSRKDKFGSFIRIKIKRPPEQGASVNFPGSSDEHVSLDGKGKHT
jgi:tRNA(Ile)-lysidine synthase